MKKIILLWLGALLLPSCARVAQPELGVRSGTVIEKGGLRFKDLNKNGTLDPYEDWRLPAGKRAEDLLARMTLDEKVGFMIISQINMGSASSADARGGDARGGGRVTSELNEQDVITDRNMFTGQAGETSINVSGTTKGILERHLRHFILRANAPARVMAEWANNVQEVAERSRLGIPAIFASNPRNHIAEDNSMGLNVGNSYFTQWPGTLGLAAADDDGIVLGFARSAAAEWVACGIRKGYMYQLDLATEPRWSRIEGTFGEDADRVARIADALVRGFQGQELGLENPVFRRLTDFRDIETINACREMGKDFDEAELLGMMNGGSREAVRRCRGGIRITDSARTSSIRGGCSSTTSARSKRPSMPVSAALCLTMPGLTGRTTKRWVRPTITAC